MEERRQLAQREGLVEEPETDGSEESFNSGGMVDDLHVHVEQSTFTDERQQFQYIHHEQQNITIVPPNDEGWRQQTHVELEGHLDAARQDIAERLHRFGQEAGVWSEAQERKLQELETAIQNLQVRVEDQTRVATVETTLNGLVDRFNQQPRIERTVIREVPPELQIQLKSIIAQQNQDRLVIDGLQSKSDRVSEDASMTESKVDSAVNRVLVIDAKIDTLIERVTTVESKIDSLSDRVSSVEATNEDLKQARNEERSDDEREELFELLFGQLKATTDRLDELNARVDENRSSIDKFDEHFDPNRLKAENAFLDRVEDSAASNIPLNIPVSLMPAQVKTQTIPNVKVEGIQPTIPASFLNPLSTTQLGNTQRGGQPSMGLPSLYPLGAATSHPYANVGGYSSMGFRPSNSSGIPQQPGGGGSGGSDDGGGDPSGGGGPGLAMPRHPQGAPGGSLLTKIPPPTKFKGDGSVGASEWILAMCRWLRTCHAPESDWTNIMMANLTGVAELWLNSVDLEIFHGHRLPFPSWNEFASELRMRFEPVTSVDVARDQLRSLRQVSSVGNYIKDFQKLTFQIPDMSMADKKAYFISGLKQPIKGQVRAWCLGDVNEAIAMASRLGESGESSQWSFQPRRFRGQVRGNQSKIPPPFKPKDQANVIEPKKKKQPDPSTPGKKPLRCYFCYGPHKVRDCPHIAKGRQCWEAQKGQKHLN